MALAQQISPSKVVGSIIEDTYHHGKNFVKLGVDVQHLDGQENRARGCV